MKQVKGNFIIINLFCVTYVHGYVKSGVREP